MDDPQLRRLAVSVDDLGETQKQLAGAVDQLRQFVNQVITANREAAGKLKVLEETLSQVVPQLNRLPRLEEELRQARDRATLLQDAFAGVAEQVEQGDKLRQAEAERERQARIELFERLEPFEQDVAGVWGRLNAAEDASRRLREQVAGFQQQLANLEQADVAMDGRLVALHEETRRGKQDVANLADELDVLRKQDEAVTGRLQVLAETLRQVDERSMGAALEERLRRETGERVDMVRVELQHVAADVSELRQAIHEQGEGIENQGRRLGQVDSRLQSLGERFADTMAEIQNYRQQMLDHVLGFAEAEEQQKRRQIGDLEQQIQELKRRALRWAGG